MDEQTRAAFRRYLEEPLSTTLNGGSDAGKRLICGEGLLSALWADERPGTSPPVSICESEKGAAIKSSSQ